MPTNKVHFKHNKFRDTAFLFEAIVRSLASARMDKDEEKANKITKILKEHFNPKTEISKELRLYNLLETKLDSRKRALRILQETIFDHQKLDSQKIFEEQTNLVKECKEIIPNFESSFVPNYKNLATIYQIFNKTINVKDRLILEDIVVSRMVEERNDGVLQHLDNLTVNMFAKKFNEVYKETLLKEQKELLGKYVMSFTPEGNLGFKVYLNEEVGRLKEEVVKLLDDEDIKKDPELTERTKKVSSLLESLNTKKLGSEDILKIMKIQQLIGDKQDVRCSKF